MNNTPAAHTKNVARVAVDVRLYFDVSGDSSDPSVVRRAALAELERVADEERICLKKQRFPNVYPIDAWHTMRLEDFQICQTCSNDETSAQTRFAL